MQQRTVAAGTAGDVLALVRSGEARSRSDLRRLTGLSRTAVGNRLAALAGLGLVLEGGYAVDALAASVTAIMPVLAAAAVPNAPAA